MTIYTSKQFLKVVRENYFRGKKKGVNSFKTKALTN